MSSKYKEEASKNYNKASEAYKRGNKSKALEYYLKAAKGGMSSAMVACGQLYLEGDGDIKRDTAKALRWFRKAADMFDAAAMNNIGCIYEKQGKYREALDWYMEAAKFRNVAAFMNIAGIYRDYYYGADLRERNFRISAERHANDVWSMCELAAYYAEAYSLENHIEKAISLYEKAFEMGGQQSYKYLGDSYLKLKQEEKAEDCYYAAAEKGNVDAMLNMSLIMADDYESFEHAYLWLLKAIHSGSDYALKMMGDLHIKFKKYPKALRWYRKAILRGEEAQDEIQEVKKLLKTSKADYKMKLRNFEKIFAN